MQVTTDATLDPSVTYNYYDSLNNVNITPSVIIIIIVVLVLFIAIFSSLGSSGEGAADGTGNNEYQKGTAFFGVLTGIVFLFIIILGGVDYFYGTTIYASANNLFTNTPEIDITLDTRQNKDQPASPAPMNISREQVFNIPGNYYGYEDAKSLCTAYGARLASYDEVENAHKDGAEWCNYGWSQNKLALFPTQKSTYDNLQKIPGHENDCGRPGINGGYMENEKIKYGVNCFGKKPDITPDEATLMSNTTPYPKTEKDIAMEKRVEYWKSKLSDILVSPFNYNQWSRV
jgi:heme/copper-type cytochrome/quinol oxidase subunit 2